MCSSAEQLQVREKIRNYADTHANVLVIGCHGLKKEQKSDYANHRANYVPGYLGKSAEVVSTGCKAVTLLVNDDCSVLERAQRRLLVAVDGSDMSHSAVEEAVRYMRPDDYLEIIYVETDGSGQRLIQNYDQFLVDNKVKGSCKSIKKHAELSIADEILDVAETGTRDGKFG